MGGWGTERAAPRAPEERPPHQRGAEHSHGRCECRGLVLVRDDAEKRPEKRRAVREVRLGHPRFASPTTTAASAPPTHRRAEARPPASGRPDPRSPGRSARGGSKTRPGRRGGPRSAPARSRPKGEATSHRPLTKKAPANGHPTLLEAHPPAWKATPGKAAQARLRSRIGAHTKKAKPAGSIRVAPPPPATGSLERLSTKNTPAKAWNTAPTAFAVCRARSRFAPLPISIPSAKLCL